MFGYPSDDQARAYCSSFKSSIAGTTGVVVAMHILCYLCMRTYVSNQHADSSIFEPLDPHKMFGLSSTSNNQMMHSFSQENIISRSSQVSSLVDGLPNIDTERF